MRGSVANTWHAATEDERSSMLLAMVGRGVSVSAYLLDIEPDELDRLGDQHGLARVWETDVDSAGMREQRHALAHPEFAPRFKRRPNMTTDHAETHTEVDLFEALAGRVRAGEPIHITGPLDGPVGLLHLATVAKLRADTGLPVHVVYH